jgi:hypothetical protein
VQNVSRSFNEGSNKYKEKCSRVCEVVRTKCHSEAVQCNSYSERVNKDDQGEGVLESSHGDIVVSDNGDHGAGNSEQLQSANVPEQLILSDHAEMLNAESEAKRSVIIGRYGSRLTVSSERVGVDIGSILTLI